MRRTVLLVLLTLAGAAHAQSERYEFERPAGTASAALRVVTQQGKLIEQQFAAGAAVAFNVRLPDGSTLADGTHRWQLSFAPVVPAQLRSAAALARAAGDERPIPGWPAAVALRSGVFFVQGGRFQPMLENEPRTQAPGKAAGPVGGNSIEVPKDQVIPDDLIVQGSGCFGFDCINNESFGVDTVRLKENSLRIHFDDTSTLAGFANNDWRLVANDQAGTAAYFSIEDSTAARVPFKVEAGAATDSIFIDSTGHVGFRTNTPVLDLHVTTSNTPALRLDQNGGGGFVPQIWDVAGNETNFFVRDVTNSSRLPFRIRPGAPTSAFDISADGDIGMGIGSPVAALHLRRSVDPASEPWLLVDRSDDSDPDTEDRRLELDRDGNLFVSGSITQLSSRTSKTHFVALAGDEVLARLSDLPIWTWNYLRAGDDDRHIGPVAEDFYAAFGFGRSARSLAPADVAGVALAATQALQQQLAERDQRISELEARLARLEAALGRGDDAPASR